MAAYAAVVTLMDTINHIQTHPQLSTCLDNKLIETLRQNFSFLQRFLEGYSHQVGSQKELDLEKIIAGAASGTDNLIRYHVAGQILNREMVDLEVARKHLADDLRPPVSRASPVLLEKIHTSDMSFPRRILSHIQRCKSCSKPEETPGPKPVDTSSSKAVGTFSSQSSETRSSKLVLTSSSKPEETSSSCSKPVERANTFLFCLKLEIERVDSIKTNVMEFQGKTTVVNNQHSKLDATSTCSTGRKTIVVGLEDEVIHLMERLSAPQSFLQVIPIIGMGGIGKTTLARCVYERPFIVHHFDIRIWITISQEITLRDILLQIPICQKESEDNQHSLTDDQLGDVLRKSLFGKRYLIVMDDMWDIEAWNDLKRFFPYNATQSRILVTTRLSNLADQFGSSPLTMALLDHNNSWELFCEMAFGQEGCSQAELEEIGKKIVEKCCGLPLSIVVIGGLLATRKIPQYWEVVASDIHSILNSADNRRNCRSILSLSYNHLPTHLKPCFLYFAIFPEDHKIHVSQVIQLWIAEGFLKPNQNQSLEVVAEAYLKDLVDRNLILVHEWGLHGKIRTCYIHDVLRDLCLEMAQRNEFINVLKIHGMPLLHVRGHRRITVHSESTKKHQYQLITYGWLAVASTLMGIRILPQFPNYLLRVLDSIQVKSLEEIFQHINLMYVGCHLISRQMIPSSISQLWNLQFIRCHNDYLTVAPIQFWRMKQLCHIQFSEICLPDPPSDPNEQDYCILVNLQTLMTIVNFKCTEEVLRRIPCIKKLKIKYEELHGESKTDAYLGQKFQGERETGSYYGLQNLHQLVKLESLHVYFYIKQSMKGDLQRCLTYPSSLKKLALDNIELCWDDLEIMGRLPHLEVLKLNGAIAGHTWNPSEGEFCSLKSLNISAYIELISWNIDESHFPVLEILDLGNAPQLDEIPERIGEIPSLKLICMGGCQASTAISALNILVEQESFGNGELEVKVSFVNSAEKESFLEMAESEGLASNKFVVHSGK